ncbi:hypothetical protein QBC34DRAFT_411157 [Podospora aff. communis PSN243]|uniref:Uncharacterized protein n=1 Tax=Podospora aff. communis PSN243 TaxID=3040156 RepID=A0AAV9GF28_9PEZI|nr:hypothetical protein QBC34DRAFT_411157 [Podospora aff. communis PSN243]
MNYRSRASPWLIDRPHPRRSLDATFDGEPFLDYLRGFALEESNSNSNGDSDVQNDLTDSSGAGGFRPDARTQAEVETNNNAETQSTEPGTRPADGVQATNDVQRFMQGSGGGGTEFEHRDQVEDVTSFIEVGIASSQRGPGERPRYMAVVDIRGVGCWASRSQPYRGALTGSRLYDELRQPIGGASDLECVSKNCRVRRIIYLSGLDARGIWVLAKTSPGSQRLALVALFYQHIRPNPRLSVTVNTKGVPSYVLHFHLPFYALRRETELLTDTREWLDNKPLRKSRVLGCLSESSSSMAGDTWKWCLYEAQTSIVVTGTHDRSWTAYGVTDDYYDSDARPDEFESVGRYHRLWEETPDMFSDPVFRGGYPLLNDRIPIDAGGNPTSAIFWDAREYFVAAVAFRAGIVSKEWSYVVTKLEKARCPSSQARHERDHVKHERVMEWNSEMLDVVADLITCLAKTTSAFEQFMGSESCDFASETYEDHLASIKGTASTLKLRLDDLRLLRERLTTAKGPAADRLVAIGNYQATMSMRQLTVLVFVRTPQNINCT